MLGRWGEVFFFFFFGEISPKSDIKNSKFKNELILEVFILPDVRILKNKNRQISILGFECVETNIYRKMITVLYFISGLIARFG